MTNVQLTLTELYEKAKASGFTPKELLNIAFSQDIIDQKLTPEVRPDAEQATAKAEKVLQQARARLEGE